ncbi:putative fatty acyl-CoA transferase [Dirofilaria immitis]
MQINFHEEIQIHIYIHRGYSEINEKRYMKIYVKDGVQPGEQIRLLVRRFPNVRADAFDVVQIGYLENNETLDLSHGGGNFLPKYPFWFDREKYMMSIRILHWVYEKKIEVTRKIYTTFDYRAIGIFQKPEEFFYTTEGYYMELVYVIGYPDRTADHSHYFYVQGERRLKYDHLTIPVDLYEKDYKKQNIDPKNSLSLQNTIEAYRNYLDKPTSFHGDTDKLILESMGLPMPYHATFNFGGFYIGQRAHFCGFFNNSIIVEIKTTCSNYVFHLHKNSVEFNNITKKIENDLYGTEYFDHLGSISLVNAGEALAIIYNVPHRFDFTHMHASIFSKQIAQFSVKWDGPITDIVFSDAIGDKRLTDLGHDLTFEGMTLLQHVDIDNELIE